MDKIRWNEPRFDSEDEKSVLDVLRDNYVNEGPRTKELEEKLKSYLGVKHVLLVPNCTAALYLAIKAESMIREISDFEVIIPDITMIATATAVGWAGGKVILVDIIKDKFTIDISKLEEKITPKTIGIVPVHTLGRAADLKGIQYLAEKHNVSIIEDAAGALGSKHDGKYLGTFGKAGCFSLQSNKIITSGQGGFIVTNDDNYYEVMRRIRDFGRLNNSEFIHKIEGYNLKFNDLSAALALSQFSKIEERKNLLVNQLKSYQNELRNISQISFPITDLDNGGVPLWIDVLVENRDALEEYLKSQGIFPRPCWPAIHMNPPYQHLGNDFDYPLSTEISKKSLWLPNGPGISGDQIKYVCSKIREFYKNN